MTSDDEMPTAKPSLGAWIDNFLPFALPDIPLLKTAANLDAAIGRLIMAGGDNLAARVDASTARLAARSAAHVEFIQAGADAAAALTKSDSALASRAITYALQSAAGEQSNREKVVRVAIDDLRNSPPTEDAEEDIEQDWLNSFSSHSSRKTNSEVQELWGRILAGEIRRPGSYSLRTLELLSSWDHNDAKAITAVFQYVINSDFVFCAEGDGAVPFDVLATGEETGVLRSVAFPSEKTRGLSAGQVAGFDAQDRWLRITCKSSTTVKYYAYTLSRPGQELFRLVGRQTVPDVYLKEFAQTLKSGGFEVMLARRGRDLGNGKFALEDVTHV